MKDTTINTVFNIYFLYPTDRDDEGNFYRLLQNFINIGTELQAYLLDWEKMDYINENTSFPKSYLHVPADHEWFVQLAYTSGVLTKEQILSINCRIIEECDLLVYFGNGRGVLAPCGIAELQYAKQKQVPVYTMPDLSPTAIQALRLAIKLILKSNDNMGANSGNSED